MADAPADGKIADLLTVLEISRELAATADLQVLLEAVEKSALKALACERASVFLHDRATDELVSRVATGGQEVRFPAGRGFAGEVFRTGIILNIPDAYADPRFNPEVDRKTGFRTRSILTCPLLGWDNTRLGVLQVLNKRGGSFDAWDEVLVKTLSAQCGVAVQRQFLLEAYAQKQRIEHDLNIARRIQQGLLPARPPQVPGFDVAGWNRPADETGGDFYDLRLLPGDRLALTVADVTGHGIGPALVATECRALARASLTQTQQVNTVADLVNRLLSEDLPDDRFVTAFFGLLDTGTAVLHYLSAGHGPILFYEATSATLRDLPAQGLPLGVAREFQSETPGEIRFAPGDLLAVFTDGFFEWSNAQGTPYGLARLQDWLRGHADLPATELIQQLYQDVQTFTGGTPQPDDLTAVVVKKENPKSIM